MQVAEKAAAEAKTADATAATDSNTLTMETPTPEGTANPSKTSSGSSSGSASPDDAVTVIPVNTAASTQEGKLTDSTTAPTMGALMAGTTSAAAGLIQPALMTPVTVMLATCAPAPTPEQLAAISAASSAKKHPMSWLNSLPDSKAAQGSEVKAAKALPGSLTSPGSPLIMAGTGDPAAEDNAGTAAADSELQKESKVSTMHT
jgi:hypothetical protein